MDAYVVWYSLCFWWCFDYFLIWFLHSLFCLLLSSIFSSLFSLPAVFLSYCFRAVLEEHVSHYIYPCITPSHWKTIFLRFLHTASCYQFTSYFLSPDLLSILRTLFRVGWLVPSRLQSSANQCVNVWRGESLCCSLILWSVGTGSDRSIFATLFLQCISFWKIKVFYSGPHIANMSKARNFRNKCMY